LGTTIRVSFSIDATLRGGVFARMGDTVYDGSVKRQLELLREQFARGVVSN
jgi:F0F1-type ATP synthase delta subunit